MVPPSAWVSFNISFIGSYTHTHALGGLELMISPSTFLLQGEVPFELELLAKLVVGISYVY